MANLQQLVDQVTGGAAVGDMAEFCNRYLQIFNEGIHYSFIASVAGRYIREPGWFERLVWTPDNRGSHVIHSGGQYDSFLQIPVIPPRYVAGDYVYR